MVKKIVIHLFDVCAVLLLAWIALSYIDIVSDNLRTIPLHSSYNIFILLSEVTGR